jgi:hypothetical protein
MVDVEPPGIVPTAGSDTGPLAAVGTEPLEGLGA